jgi:hypothetical protein
MSYGYSLTISLEYLYTKYPENTLPLSPREYQEYLFNIHPENIQTVLGISSDYCLYSKGLSEHPVIIKLYQSNQKHISPADGTNMDFLDPDTQLWS